MANTIIGYWHPIAGKTTLTLELYAPDAAGGLLNSGGADAFTEHVSIDGYYTATVTEAVEDNVLFRVLDGTAIVAQGTKEVADTTETYVLNEPDIHFDPLTDLVIADIESIEGEDATDYFDGLIDGTGTGARTISITVDDGTDPLESAKVRLTKGAESYVSTTDVNGDITFNVDDGTWVVAITLPGYTFAGASLVVNGDETQTYSLTALSITPPSDPELCTGYMVTVDKEGLPVADIDITVKLVDGPGTAGYAYERNLWIETSDADGYVEFVGLVRGAKYRIRRETSEWVEFVVPDADTVALAEVVG